MKKIFISHPFSDDPIDNKSKCKLLLEDLHKIYPYVIFISPLHLFDYMEDETPNQREEIMRICYTLIDLSDEIWIYGNSEGCIKEQMYASSINKKVFLKRR